MRQKKELFNWNLRPMDFEIEMAASALSDLNRIQENSLKANKKRFDNFVESNRKSVESLPDEDQGSYYSHLHYVDEMVIIDLQRLQRYSMVIIIFSVFESRLLAVCTEIENQLPELRKLQDIKGNKDLEKYWQYLTKIVLINIERLQPLFQRFNQQKFLRNVITHHNGVFSNADKKKINIINGISLREFGSEYIIQIDENTFVEYLLNHLKQFFGELSYEVDNRFKEIKK
jgi:hypothetical protein